MRYFLYGYIALTIIFTLITTGAYAYIEQKRNLPEINIIKREQRIQQQGAILKATPQETTQGGNNKNNNKEDNQASKSKTINSYLSSVAPEDVVLDGIIRQLHGKELTRARGYKQKKTHLIIHHTANDISKIQTPEQAKSMINKIFIYHTINNKWGDIGYNFIIDPWGNIYEGRGGGESVIGAHTKYNNATSIGIALLGNFEINQPTQAQINALTTLGTALMIRYNINPDSEIYAHVEQKNHPYIEHKLTDAFIGHREAGKTACPGKNLFVLLPNIQNNIRKALIQQKKLSKRIKARRIHYINTPYTIEVSRMTTLTIPLPQNSHIIRCSAGTKHIKLSCKRGETRMLEVSLQPRTHTIPDYIAINVTTKITDPNLKIIIPTNTKLGLPLNQDQETQPSTLRTDQKDAYIKKNKPKLAQSHSHKFKQKISLTDIQQLAKEHVHVLLYEASKELPERSFLCTDCITIDEKGYRYEDQAFTIINHGSYLTYKSNTTEKIIKKLSIQSQQEQTSIRITNYKRKSYQGIPRNHFYGTITISQQPIKDIDTKKQINSYALINTIPLDIYMRGIIESNDTEALEKAKTMSILARNYMLFYSHPSHRHPNIPSNAEYNAVDDARIFQKYVGAGVDHTLQQWKQVVESTKNKVVMYENNLAFVPYFNCSAGFTWSAEEKFGWQDTPYLKSIPDPKPCKDFNGHGVGLAGNGASHLAQEGYSHEQIIQYFYPGTSIASY